MLESLKFVMGAVAKKDFVPSMTHFEIRDGFVFAYNGKLALGAPIACNLTCRPKAAPLVKAIGLCAGAVVLSQTSAGRLRVQSGQFKAFVDCTTDETPATEPTGDDFPINGEALVAGLKLILPFTGTDASRPWAMGILLKGQSCFATNNVCLVERWLGFDVAYPVNISKDAVKEIIRVGAPPISARADENSISFLYEDGSWIKCQLMATDWPDLSRVLDLPSEPIATPENLFKGLDTLRPFADKLNRVYLDESGKICTHLDVEEGAMFELAEINANACFSLDMLALLDGIAERIDFTMYPKPCAFFGDKLRGAIAGLIL